MYELLIAAPGMAVAAGLALWAQRRALNKRIRRLKADAAADRYRADIYRNALIDITRMGYPHQTLRNAQERAGGALGALEVVR
jgi:hypothetical protein